MGSGFGSEGIGSRAQGIRRRFMPLGLGLGSG